MVRPIILYCKDYSPPVRAAWLTAKTNGVSLESRYVYAGDHLKLEHVKETVPTLEDNGKVISDNHGICTYLIDKHAKNDLLYPAQNTCVRAKINQHLHSDTDVLFIKSCSSSKAIYLKAASEFPNEDFEEIHHAYTFMEALLNDDPNLVGSHMALADLCRLATVSAAQDSAPISSARFPRLHDWFQRLNELPFYDEVNGKRVEELRKLMMSTMSSNKEYECAIKNS